MPAVLVYEFLPASMAAWAAALIGSGTSKCGWPILKFTGSFKSRAISDTHRMPDGSTCHMRAAIRPSTCFVPDVSRGLLEEIRRWSESHEPRRVGTAASWDRHLQPD